MICWINLVLFIGTVLVLALSTRTSAERACRPLAVTFAFPGDNYYTILPLIVW